MVNSADFAKRMEELFQYYDLNASSFAEKIDVGRASISHLLSGRNKPSLDFVMKVVHTFPEVELYWLLNGKGSFPKKSPIKEAQQVRSISTAAAEKETEETQIKKEVTPTTKNENEVHSQEKIIQRIVIFYNDGTFEAFNHS